MKFKKMLLLMSRFILGAVFIFAAVGKIYNPAAFAGDIDNYRMLPYILVTLMAVVLPWIELICGVLLISGKWLKGSSFIVIIMNIMFIVAIASAMARGLDIDCGCFSVGSSASRVGMVRLIQDFLWLALAVIVFRDAIKKRA